ncbi:MAG: zinc-ribbon domain-containing protein [Promethearchaeota archaeon]
MAYVPTVFPHNSNRGYRNRGGGPIVAILIFVLFLGLVIFLFSRQFNRFVIPIWSIIIGLGVLFIIIIVISAIASSMSQNYRRPIENKYKQHQSNLQQQGQQSNPYIYQDTIQKRLDQNKNEDPLVDKANYCRYCGSKIDRDTRFCHQCGSKI